MEITGLTIGDKLLLNGHPHTIQGLQIQHGNWMFYSKELQVWCSVKDAFPIFISQTFLAKNFDEKNGGFKYGIFEDYFDLSIEEYNDGTYSIEYHITERSLPDTVISNVCYVHELQHALNHFGLSKELEL